MLAAGLADTTEAHPMPALTRSQLTLLAQAAETLTKLRNLAFDTVTPKPPERIAIMPGVVDLVVVGNKGLQTGFYALDVSPQPTQGEGESGSPG